MSDITTDQLLAVSTVAAGRPGARTAADDDRFKTHLREATRLPERERNRPPTADKPKAGRADRHQDQADRSDESAAASRTSDKPSDPPVDDTTSARGDDSPRAEHTDAPTAQSDDDTQAPSPAEANQATTASEVQPGDVPHDLPGEAPPDSSDDTNETEVKTDTEAPQPADIPTNSPLLDSDTTDKHETDVAEDVSAADDESVADGAEVAATTLPPVAQVTDAPTEPAADADASDESVEVQVDVEVDDPPATSIPTGDRQSRAADAPQPQEAAHTKNVEPPAVAPRQAPTDQQGSEEPDQHQQNDQAATETDRPSPTTHRAAQPAGEKPAAENQPAVQLATSDAPPEAESAGRQIESAPSDATNTSARAESVFDRLARGVLQPNDRPTESTVPRQVDAARFVGRVSRAFQVAQDRGGSLQLRLSPPELGSLRLEVTVQEGALVAKIETETAAARTVLLDNLPALRDRLAEQQIRIERFDVDVQGETGNSAEGFGAQDRQNEPPGDERHGLSTPATPDVEHDTPDEPRRRIFVDERSINLIV